MDRQHLDHFLDHPLTRIASWVVKGLFGALVAVTTTFVAHYAGTMSESITELKNTVKVVVERVDALERENAVRAAQWDAYREAYDRSMQSWKERQGQANAQ